MEINVEGDKTEDRGNIIWRRETQSYVDRCVCNAFHQHLWVVKLDGEYDFDGVIS